jgi:hypothetical protein
MDIKLPQKEAIKALLERLDKDVKVLSQFKNTERFAQELKELTPGIEFLRELLNLPP